MLEDTNHRIAVLESKMSQTAEWDSIEQLLLAMFRQPVIRTVASEEHVPGFLPSPAASTSELNRINGPNNIR
jgi:hypothetical protein